MTWTINTQLFSALALTNVTRERYNLATDRVTFTADGRNIDLALLFAYDAPVTILRDGVPFFSGRAGRCRQGQGVSRCAASIFPSGRWPTARWCCSRCWPSR